MLDKTFNDRYRLVAKIGRGGMGEVYRAEDSLLKRDVAIKVLFIPGEDTEIRHRLLHEAQTVARLNHPNIVSIYDVQSEGDSPYIVMELVNGIPLRKAGSYPLAENLRIACQICEALEHAHTHGVIHRDLKPENILVAESGNSKLVDFGLARSVASQLTLDGAIVGTVFYMAPELAMGQDFDHRVDLYSLGIILYEMATGKLPFTGNDPIAVISQHLHAPPVPPKAVNTAVAAPLNKLVLNLLSKDPADRPATASEVRQQLQQILAGESPAEVDEYVSDELRVLDRIARGRLVGRGEELGELRELWSRAMAGELAVLLISGEPGIGKSRLVRELATQVEASGGLVFRGECIQDAGLPFGPFVEILHQGLSEKRSDEVNLPASVLADLITIAPTLIRTYPDVPANPPLDPNSERYRLFESILYFLLAQSSSKPTVVVLEDLHWADQSSLSLLRHLARRSLNEKLCFVSTYREVELEEASPFFELLDELNRHRLSKRVKLSRLDRNETSQLLQVLLGERISPELVESVYYETEGNPFFIEEMCKSLAEEGKIYQIDGQWKRVDSADVLIPQSIRMVVQSRLRKVRPETRELLQIAAVLGRDFNPELLDRASEFSGGQVTKGLEEAEQAQLIQSKKLEDRYQFAFAHALIPAALREEVSGVRRANLHKQAADAIQSMFPEDFEALAYHYSEAGDSRRARRYYVRAANRARASYANQEALDAYTKALELAEDTPADRYDLLASRVKIFDILARREEQQKDAQALVDLSKTLRDTQRECDAWLALADIFLVTDHSQAREPAESSAELARSIGDLYREGQALRRLGDQAHRSYDYLRSRTLLETAAARFRKTGFSAEAAGCLSLLSVVLSNLGENEEAVRSAREAVQLSRNAGDRRGEGTSLRRLGINYLDQSKFSEAEEPLLEALRIHREIGDRSEECNDLNVLGVIQAKQKKVEAAQESFDQSLEIADQIGSVTAILFAINNQVLFHYKLNGDFEAGIAFLQAWLFKAQDFDDEFMFGTILLRLADLFAAVGTYADAVGAFNKGEPIATRLMGPQVQINLFSQRGLWKTFQGDVEGGFKDLDLAFTQARNIGGHSLIEAIPLTCWATAVLWESSLNEIPNGIRRAEQAIDLLRGSSGSWVDVLGKALGTSARLHLRLSRGNDVAAEKALSRASEVVRLAEESPEVSSPQEYLAAYAFALRTAGREEEARAYLGRAYDWVRDVAGRIEDDNLRRSWLEAVPENREILSAREGM